jgi:hypothetical protein
LVFASLFIKMVGQQPSSETEAVNLTHPIFHTKFFEGPPQIPCNLKDDVGDLRRFARNGYPLVICGIFSSSIEEINRRVQPRRAIPTGMLNARSGLCYLD